MQTRFAKGSKIGPVITGYLSHNGCPSFFAVAMIQERTYILHPEWQFFLFLSFLTAVFYIQLDAAAQDGRMGQAMFRSPFIAPYSDLGEQRWS